MKNLRFWGTVIASGRARLGPGEVKDGVLVGLPLRARAHRILRQQVQVAGQRSRRVHHRHIPLLVRHGQEAPPVVLLQGRPCRELATSRRARQGSTGWRSSFRTRTKGGGAQVRKAEGAQVQGREPGRRVAVPGAEAEKAARPTGCSGRKRGWGPRRARPRACATLVRRHVLHLWGGTWVSYVSGAEGHTRGCSGRRKAGSHAAR